MNNLNIDINYVEKNKELFCELFNKDKYNYDAYIANGLYYVFFYLEFHENISYFEIISLFLKEQLRFYNEKFIYENEKTFFNPKISSRIANDKDIEDMDILFNEVINMIKNQENSWCSIKNKSKEDNNNDIIGYYLNHFWQSDTFPIEIKEKIFSADKYIILINEGSEVMMAMEHKGKQSLFYSMNDQ